MEPEKFSPIEGLYYFLNIALIVTMVILLLFCVFIFPYVFFETGHAMPVFLHQYEEWLSNRFGVTGLALDALVYFPFLLGIFLCALISSFLTKRLEIHKWRGRLAKAFEHGENPVTHLEAAKRRAEGEEAEEETALYEAGYWRDLGTLIRRAGLDKLDIPPSAEEIEKQLWENTGFTRRPFFWLMLFIAIGAGLILLIDFIVIMDHSIHVGASRP